MSKKHKNDKRIADRGNRFDWITEGFPELQEDIELHLKPKREDTITIPRDEYDTLIADRAKLNLIAGLQGNISSYMFEELMKAIFPVHKEATNEPKSE